jgi:hypothetical protein
MAPLGTVLALAACSDLPAVSMANGLGFFGRAPEKIPVVGRSVVVAGPPGYCVDPRATHDSAVGAFVLLGSCASIANTATRPAPANPAVLTASVSTDIGADVSGAISQLGTYVRSDAGRAALARDGRAASVRILKTRWIADTFLLKARDDSRRSGAGLAPDYWRALFALNGKLMTLSILEFDAKPIPDDIAVATLNSFVERIRQENAAPARPEENAI